MTTFGLTATGFVAKRASDCRDSIRASIATELAARGLPTDIDYDTDTVAGVISDALAVECGLGWDTLQAVYDGTDPNNATGLQQDNVGAFVGITRQAPSYSTVDLTVTGDAGTVLEAGRLAENADGSAQWQLTETITLTGGSDSVAARATVRGAVQGLAGQITVIRTPVQGWSTVTNASAATVGNDREQDAAYRERRTSSLQRPGGPTQASLAAAALEVDGVDSVIILSNETALDVVIDGKTVKANSVLPVVGPNPLSSTAQDALAQALFNGKAAGIQVGNGANDVSRSISGSGFASVNVGFDYLTDVTCDDVITVTLDADAVLANVTSEITALRTAFYAARSGGEDIYSGQLVALAMGVTGVLNATATINAGAVQAINNVQRAVAGTISVTT